MSHYQNIGEFADEILSQIKEYLPQKETKDYSFEVVNVPKNNGILLTGIAIKEEKRNISPTIYLNDFYRKWQNGEYMSLRSVLKEVADKYICNSIPPEFDISDITDFERVKGQITRRLIDYEMNQELLSTMPYKLYENLAVVYSIKVGNESLDDGIMTVKLDNKLFEHYGISLDELDEIAKENTARIFKPSILPLAEVMFQQVKGYIKDTFTVNEEKAWEIFSTTYEVPSMQVFYVGNEAKLYGAVYILDEDVQNELAETLGSRFCVIPSSVNEILAVPFDGDFEDYHMYEQMISVVNEDSLPQTEILSNTAYMIDVKNHVMIRMDRAEEYFKEQEKEMNKEEALNNENEQPAALKRHRIP